MTRFALILPRTQEAAHVARAAAAARALADADAAELTLARGHALVWPSTPVLDLDGRGLIIGALFDGRSPARTLSAAERDAIIESRGQALIERYWGSYVAWLGDDDRLLRAPFGDTSVYVVRTLGVIAAVSDAELLLRLPDYRPRLSLARLAQAVLDPRLASRATGLAGIDELLPGEALDLASRAVTRCWQPPDTGAPVDAAPLLRQALDTTIAAMSTGHDRLGVLLSGGLDSSIALGTLRRFLPPERLVALHHHMPSLAPELDRLPESVVVRPGLAAVAGASDELGYAEIAARQAGVELVVHRRRLDAFDLSSLADAPLTMAPSSLAFRLDADAAETRLFTEHGLAALVTGRGGDQIFYSTTSAWTAADWVRRNGLGRGWWRAVTEAAVRSGLPLPTVAWLSLRHGWGRGRVARARLEGDTGFLAADRLDACHRASAPPSDDVDALPPGRAQQLSDLLDLAAYAENPSVPVLNPMVAQPVVEACLALPTYVLAEHGLSRGLARRAFADRVPVEITGRLHKAGGTGFMHRLVAARRSELCDLLLGGVLAGAGLLDLPRLEARLGDDAQWREIEPIRLMDLVAVEAWARQWVGRGAALD